MIRCHGLEKGNFHNYAEIDGVFLAIDKDFGLHVQIVAGKAGRDIMMS